MLDASRLISEACSNGSIRNIPVTWHSWFMRLLVSLSLQLCCHSVDTRWNTLWRYVVGRGSTLIGDSGLDRSTWPQLVYTCEVCRSLWMLCWGWRRGRLAPFEDRTWQVSFARFGRELSATSTHRVLCVGWTVGPSCER